MAVELFYRKFKGDTVEVDIPNKSVLPPPPNTHPARPQEDAEFNPLVGLPREEGDVVPAPPRQEGADLEEKDMDFDITRQLVERNAEQAKLRAEQEQRALAPPQPTGPPVVAKRTKTVPEKATATSEKATATSEKATSAPELKVPSFLVSLPLTTSQKFRTLVTRDVVKLDKRSWSMGEDRRLLALYEEHKEELEKVPLLSLLERRSRGSLPSDMNTDHPFELS